MSDPKAVKPLSVLVLGLVGADNTGDELISIATERFLRDRLGITHIGVFSLAPARTARQRQHISVYPFHRRFDRTWLRSLGEMIRTVRRYDLLMLGGGGLLQDVHSWATPIQFLMPGLLAALLGKRIWINNLGIGPLRRKTNRRFTAAALELYDLITVRDDYSRRYLAELKLKNRVTLGMDPVFWLRNDFRIPKAERAVPEIGISLRYWPGFELESFTRALSQLHDRYQFKCVLYPFEEADSGGDSALLQDLGNRLEQLGVDYQLLPPFRDPLDLCSAINRVDYFIGMRYHSVITAAISGLPVIALAYDNKVSALGDLLVIPLIEIGPDLEGEVVRELEWFFSSKRPGDDVTERGMSIAAKETELVELFQVGLTTTPVAHRLRALGLLLTAAGMILQMGIRKMIGIKRTSV